MTVKWTGLPYSAITTERLVDIRSAGIDFEEPLRRWIRREQLKPCFGPSRRVKVADKCLKEMESQEPPPMKGGELRDYQWEGVRWLIYNWTQKRNSILADEMGLGKCKS